MTDPVENQDTQKDPNENVNQESAEAVTEETTQTVTETPVNKENQEVSDIETLKRQLDETRAKAQEEAQKRAVIEARYQELGNIRNQNLSVSNPPKPSLREMIKTKAKGMADTIIERPEEAANILTETLVDLAENIKSESISQSKYLNDIDSTLSNIERDNPHLSSFKSNIQASAAEMLQRGECRTLKEALEKSAEKLNEVFKGFAESKGRMSANLSTEKITSKGNLGNVNSIKNPQSKALPETVVAVDQEWKDRHSRLLKKRI